jgi:hypothetical protein
LQRDGFGNTAFHYAVSKNYPVLLKMLREYCTNQQTLEKLKKITNKRGEYAHEMGHSIKNDESDLVEIKQFKIGL